jgi:hypothetical protein
MKTILRLEELVKLAACYLLSLKIGFSYWVFWVWLLVPDISMIGYLVNTRVGAVIYNLVHHQGLAIIIGLAGLYTGNVYLEFTGLLLLGHSSMDRIFGYGLKYTDSFKHTHLGELNGGNLQRQDSGV